MIEEIHVRDLALIKKCEMHFKPGFTVLTGETGAGKTALLGALRLATGERADAASVREGQDSALVEARFSCGPKTEQLLKEADIPSTKGELLIRRKVLASGNSRCHINDAMSTVGNLAAIAGPMVDLHGQHGQQKLLVSSSHTGLIDRWGKDEIYPLLNAYQEAFNAYAKARDELERAREAERVSDFKLEQARFACKEIGKVSPAPNELAELESRLPILKNGEALSEAASRALEAIRSQDGAVSLLDDSLNAMRKVSSSDKSLDELANRLESAMLDLEDLSMELRAYRDSVDFDPAALEQALDRLGELDGLVRRFGPTYEDVLSTWEESQTLLEDAEYAVSRITDLENDLNECEAKLKEAAANLDTAREQQANKLADELGNSAQELAMKGASFSFTKKELAINTWTLAGSSRYELMYSPSSQMTPRPLARIASGGELSRVMLALESVMDDGDRFRTLVFDEVDAGLGGAAAQAVGERLRTLSKSHQVIVVTHLAQIAALADSHLLVKRSSGDGIPETQIFEISGEDRVREISRMLSGTDDDASIAHARAMLSTTGDD